MALVSPSSNPLPMGLRSVIYLLLVGCFAVTSANNFNKNFILTWGEGKAKTLSNGRQLALSLDKDSGSAFESKSRYLFARIDMQIKLVPGDSAGTVTTFYMSSMGPKHDEIDFEFLGNQTGQPYTLHTNVFSQGKGDREQQFRLWFDPTEDFHTYSIVWTTRNIMFSVDGTPVRVFKNMESIGVPFPKQQPMRVYGSLWNADDWATQGGRVKTDWGRAPFIATYGSYRIKGCKWVRGASSCSTATNPTSTSSTSTNKNMNDWMVGDQLNLMSQERLNWVRSNYMIYDYCADKNRFPLGLPPECSAS